MPEVKLAVRLFALAGELHMASPHTHSDRKPSPVCASISKWYLILSFCWRSGHLPSMRLHQYSFTDICTFRGSGVLVTCPAVPR